MYCIKDSYCTVNVLISDKEIVKRSCILNKNLWDDNDSIMVDRGFTIHNELAPLNVELNTPSFLGGRPQ